MKKITISRTEWNPEGATTRSIKVVTTDRTINEVRDRLAPGLTARRYSARDAALPIEKLSGSAFLFG